MYWRNATYIGYVASLLALTACGRLCAAQIAISHTSDMSFGQVVSSTFGGTVSISTAGIRTASGIAVVPSSSSSRAVFEVTGDNNTTYAITLPSSVALSGSGPDMTLDTFVSNPSDTGLLNGVGAQTLYVGATLHVSANQQAGAYNGTMDVSVAYN